MRQFTLYNLKVCLKIQKEPLLYYVPLINKSIFLIVNITKVKMKYHYFLSPLYLWFLYCFWLQSFFTTLATNHLRF